MKKALFYPALVVLILANVIVYSCQKEHVVTAVPVTTNQEVGDRAAPCSPINIANGVGLVICGIDNGAGSCSNPCTALPSTSELIVANAAAFPFLNSNVISLTNPTGADITCGIFAGTCAGIVATIPAGGVRIFRVTLSMTGCCVVTPGC
ncbi:MAG: hypothetical protein IPH31_10865 [Lewinellaceae bacterium]|nr:hypothetical protein [Lewinellaceae bacterium]